ncbi:MAG: formylglycine-generating enzyme family protein [Myxococcota bacterium]
MSVLQLGSGLIWLFILTGCVEERTAPSSPVRAPAPSPEPAPPPPPEPTPSLVSMPTPQPLTVSGYEMVYIHPGTFVMGRPFDEEDYSSQFDQSHPVMVTQGYYMGKTEVTQGMWRLVMGDLSPLDKKHFIHVHHPPEPCRNYGLGDDLPMYCLTWFEAVSFANTLSAAEGLEPCYRIEGEDVQWPGGVRCEGYRLPTEAEWEYAARAGTTTPVWTGDDLDAICSYSNIHDCNPSDVGPRSVTERPPNPWRLHDIYGNVEEWCWDWYAGYPLAPLIDPIGPPSGTSRIKRGETWNGWKGDATASYRSFKKPDEFGYTGLRLVRSYIFVGEDKK